MVGGLDNRGRGSGCRVQEGLLHDMTGFTLVHTCDQLVVGDSHGNGAEELLEVICRMSHMTRIRGELNGVKGYR